MKTTKKNTVMRMLLAVVVTAGDIKVLLAVVAVAIVEIQ
jgi:hypothetical protein